MLAQENTAGDLLVKQVADCMTGTNKKLASSRDKPLIFAFP